jgi:hypothetical protein
MKLKLWEIAVLAGVVLVAFIISLILKSLEVPEAKIDIPEGASDAYITEQAYRHSDEGACYLIDDDAERDECLGFVEDRVFLEESAEAVEEELGGASKEDLRLLGKAMISKDPAFCEQIVDEVTKEKCLGVAT